VAIFHLNARIVKRSQGQSVVAKAAYNARDLLTNENTGDRHDYRHKGKTLFSGIFIPKDAPEWVQKLAQNRQDLWSAIEGAEKRKDSQLAREVEISLPHELTEQQREYLVKDFVRENFTRKGMIADVSLHAPSGKGDARNYHAHILLSMRQIGPDGFGEKVREWNSKEQLQQWRGQWEHLVNRHLERYGHQEKIDHRSLKEQGVDREPTIHVGPVATDFEREGIETGRGTMRREIEDRNRQLGQLQAIDKELSMAIATTQSQIDHELRELQRSMARKGASMYDRADRVSMEHDAMRHIKDAHKMQRLMKKHESMRLEQKARATVETKESDTEEQRRQEEQTRGQAEKKAEAGRKKTPDPAMEKIEHKRNTTEQTEYQQRRAEREALRQQMGLRKQEGRERDDGGRGERERER